MAKKINELQEILRKKDEDMKQMEERYKRYVEKARTVSPPKQNVSSAHNFKESMRVNEQLHRCDTFKSV